MCSETIRGVYLQSVRKCIQSTVGRRLAIEQIARKNDFSHTAAAKIESNSESKSGERC